MIDPLDITAILVVVILPRLGVHQALHLRLEEDLFLGELGGVHGTHLGDLVLLLVGQLAIAHALVGVLLLEARHGQFDRALRCLVFHTGII